MEMTAEATGLILHLQRLSTEDGPGIRTTVFYKGCPLQCAWCHNPESISSKPQVQWLEQPCIGCRTCLDVCPNHALSMQADGLHIDRSVCAGCGWCAEACPSNALELLGKRSKVDELAAELLKDKVYFETSEGGVTLSGGEPTLQLDFSRALIVSLRDAGVPVALDTCGLCKPETLLDLAGQVEYVLYDLKLADPTLHKQFTGVDNERILANLRLLTQEMRSGRITARLWIRTPLIPDATATMENLKAVSALLAAEFADVTERWELCAFNNLCRDKYRRLGLEWDFCETALMTKDQLTQAGEWAKAGGFDATRIFVTGAARVED